MMKLKNILLFLVILCLSSCGSAGKKALSKRVGLMLDMPNLVVYKTTNDYANNVPVIMNADRTRIVRYFAPTDVRRGEGYANPILLEDGYLLDCFGITQNVVFLDYTLEQYANLSQVPSIDELMLHIVDKHPILEMWNCGKTTLYKTIDDVNFVVKSNFQNCKRLK